MTAPTGLIEREAEKWEQWAANGPYYVQLSYEEGVRDGLRRALEIIESGGGAVSAVDKETTGRAPRAAARSPACSGAGTPHGRPDIGAGR